MELCSIGTRILQHRISHVGTLCVYMESVLCCLEPLCSHPPLLPALLQCCSLSVYTSHLNNETTASSHISQMGMNTLKSEKASPALQRPHGCSWNPSSAACSSQEGLDTAAFYHRREGQHPAPAATEGLSQSQPGKHSKLAVYPNTFRLWVTSQIKKNIRGPLLMKNHRYSL